MKRLALVSAQQRSELFAATASRMGITPAAAEKDYTASQNNPAENDFPPGNGSVNKMQPTLNSAVTGIPPIGIRAFAADAVKLEKLILAV